MKPESPVLAGYPVQEFTLGHGIDGVPAHPAVRWDEHTFLSRHTLSDEEIEEVVRTREVYVFHGSVEKRLQPVRLEVRRPEYRLRCLSVGEGSTLYLFHGLEVTEAGGTEADRLDYVAVEAAEALAARVGLPCQVELVREKREGLEGGETCTTRAQVEEALGVRLKKALDVGGRRVELRAGPARERVIRADVVELTPRQIAESASQSVPG